MSTHRLAAQIESVDRDTLTTSPADAAALLSITAGMVAARLKGRASKETAEDAGQVAAVLACSLLDTMAGDLTATAALASYRACLAALEDQGTTKEDAADVLATDDTGAPLLRITLPGTVDPARAANTTDRDRLTEAIDSLSDEDPAAADLLALATYLDPEDGRSWRDGVPSASPMVEALGMTQTGRNRAKVARRIADAFTLAPEHMTATLHRHTIRIHRGADNARWEAHRTQVNHPATSGPAPLTPGTTGSELILSPTTAEPFHLTRRTGVEWAQSPAGDLYLTPGPWEPSTEPTQHVSRYDRTEPTYRAEQVPSGRPSHIGRDRITPRSGTASPIIHTDTTTGDKWLQVTPGAMATLVAIPADLDPDWILAQVTTLPAYRRTEDDQSTDNYAAAQEPIGPVAKVNRVKRKRDGAIGSPMTSGPTKARY